jgi:hypothetical protein
MKKHRSRYLVISFLLFAMVLFAFMATLAGAFDRTHWIERGQAVLKPFKQQLMGVLAEELQDGAGDAIEVCRVLAPQIAEDLGSETIQIGRTSHRLRNPDNAPRPWVAPLLKAYAADPGKTAPDAVALPGGGAGYVEPIHVKTMCLTCHGETLHPAVREKIEKLYPGDQAAGFKAGDFRGLFWIEFSQIKGDES